MVKVVKLYSDGWGRDLNNDYTVNLVRIRPAEQILLDLSIIVNSGIKQVLVFFEDEEEVRGKLKYFKGNRCVMKFFRGISELAPAVKTFEANDTKSILMQEASKGRLEFTKDEILGKIMRGHSCDLTQAKSVLSSLLCSQVLCKKKYEINELKIVLFSLRLPHYTQNLLKFSLSSLQYDEISLTKANILSRLSSVFNVKVTKTDWKSFKHQNLAHRRSGSSFESSENFYIKKGKICLFGRNYEGLDSYAQDVFAIKSSALWRDFCTFCDDYFQGPSRRLLPMGRFGLVLAVRRLGPDSLRYLTKGKLVYMVNLALRENFLTFYKSCLTIKHNSLIASPYLVSKLNHIKNCIVSATETFKRIHLSQLRQVLRKFHYVALNLQELGYGNLTELVQSTLELSLEAQVVKLNDNNGESIRFLSNFIVSVVLQNQYSISLTDLHSHFVALMPRQASCKEGDFRFLVQFIQRYCSREVMVCQDASAEVQLVYKMDSEENNQSFACSRPEAVNDLHDRGEPVNDDNSDLSKSAHRGRRFSNIRILPDKKPEGKDSNNSCLSSPSTPSNPE